MKSNQLYILNGRGVVVPEPDVLKWGRWFEKNRDRRIVGRTKVNGNTVSTVFLGIDHGWGKVPVLWETLVFDGDMEDEMFRCSGNREQAESMHTKVVTLVKMGVKTRARA